MSSRTGVVASMWLACAMTVVLTWLAFGHGYDEEYGSRSGAEPVLAGLSLAMPFFVLAVVELFAATGAGLWSTRSQVLCLVGATVAAVVVWVLVIAVGRGVPEATPAYLGAIGAWLLLPLLPAWVLVARPVGRRGRATA